MPNDEVPANASVGKVPDSDCVPEAITSAEKWQRQADVDQARANVRLEGFIPSAEREEAARRYIAGEIDIAGFLDGISCPRPRS